MIKVLTISLVAVLLYGCGTDTDTNANETLDVTPANAKNIVEHTGAKVNTMVQQNKESLAAAIDAQTTQ